MPSAPSPAPVRSSMSGSSGAITPSSAVSIATAPTATARIARRRLIRQSAPVVLYGPGLLQVALVDRLDGYSAPAAGSTMNMAWST